MKRSRRWGAIRKRFEDEVEDQGGWATAKERAGLNTRPQKFTDQELLDMLKDCKKRYGKVSASVFANGDYCSPETVQRRLEREDDSRGGWQIAKEEAEVV